ncbi:MAG: DNA polymerase III subunit gamma/tau [Chloroflexi bacterium]|nr:DNA polymerase III subunit gamma/tau [Chloroflexota bacterium]
MTSQVYYRKWRPGCFADLVGQEHVATTLRQAIRQGRVSHSYLFCGPRGTGKTTTARILAKAVNCLDPQDGDPCNQCSICVSFNDERFMDTIEMDAASNRGIEDIREIRDKVNFAPVEGRRKVYIIDEAHMLTDQASNAFLKTLEEPPGHVIFILCTTEANRILPTIVSRCQRFDFRRLPSERIYQRLAEITEGEGVAVAPDALRLVARFAAGSLRDAENLLEQLVVSYGDGVTLAQVEELLGLGHSDRWLDLVKYLLMGNTTASLELINQAAWDGVDLRQLHRQTLELLRAAMLLEWNAADALELPEHVTAQLRELSNSLPNWRIVKALRIWGEVNMRYDAPSTLPLELAVVEICNDDLAPPAQAAAPEPAARAATSPPPRRAQSDAAPTTPMSGAGTPPPGEADRSRTAPRPSARSVEGPRTAPVRPQASDQQEVPAGGVGGDNDVSVMWQATVKALGRATGKRYNLGALLRDCKPNTITIEGDTLLIPFVHRPNLERMQEELEDPNARNMVAEAVTRHFGSSYEFKITLAGESEEGAQPNRPNQHSPLVRTAMNMGARIVEDTIE